MGRKAKHNQKHQVVAANKIKKKQEATAEDSEEDENQVEGNAASEGEQNDLNENDSDDAAGCKHVKSVSHKNVEVMVNQILNKKRKGRKKKDETGLPSYLCLTCGSSFDSDSDVNSHCPSKHPLYIRIPSLVSHCSTCDIDLSIDDFNTKKQSPAFKKLEKSIEVIKKLIHEDEHHADKHSHSKEKHDGDTSHNKPSYLLDNDDDDNNNITNSVPLRGLRNLGNTCFFNSVMQNMAASPALISYFSKESPSLPLQSQLSRFVLDMNAPMPSDSSSSSSTTKSNKKSKSSSSYANAYTPSGVLNELGKTHSMFKSGRQQDSHELLRSLLSQLVNETEEYIRAQKRVSVYQHIKTWTPDDVLTFIDTLQLQEGEHVKQSLINSTGVNGNQPFDGRLIVELAENWTDSKIGKKLRERFSLNEMKDRTIFTKAFSRIRSGLKPSLTPDSDNVTLPTPGRVDPSSSDALTSTFVHNIFAGIASSTVECLTCHQVSTTSEIFFDLSLPIEPPRIVKYEINKHKSKYENPDYIPQPSNQKRKSKQTKSIMNQKGRLSKSQRKLQKKKSKHFTTASPYAAIAVDSATSSPHHSSKSSPSTSPSRRGSSSTSQQALPSDSEGLSTTPSASTLENGDITSQSNLTEQLNSLSIQDKSETSEHRNSLLSDSHSETPSTVTHPSSHGVTSKNVDNMKNESIQAPDNEEVEGKGDVDEEDTDTEDAEVGEVHQHHPNGKDESKENKDPQGENQEPKGEMKLPALSDKQKLGVLGLLGMERIAGDCSLSDCLAAFTDPDLLSGTNSYGCSLCTERARANGLRTPSPSPLSSASACSSSSSASSKVTVEIDSSKTDSDLPPSPHPIPLSSETSQESSTSLAPPSPSPTPSPSPSPSWDDSSDAGFQEPITRIPTVKTEAKKSVKVSVAPRILTLHLKRFTQSGNGRLEKVNKHVKFDTLLDFTPYMDSPSRPHLYELYGVVVHSGSMGGGHYIAYVKKGNGNWYYFSDSDVRPVAEGEVLNAQAYLVFYQRIE